MTALSDSTTASEPASQSASSFELAVQSSAIESPTLALPRCDVRSSSRGYVFSLSSVALSRFPFESHRASQQRTRIRRRRIKRSQQEHVSEVGFVE